MNEQKVAHKSAVHSTPSLLQHRKRRKNVVSWKETDLERRKQRVVEVVFAYINLKIGKRSTVYRTIAVQVVHACVSSPAPSMKRTNQRV
jgi:hypothetical protein